MGSGSDGRRRLATWQVLVVQSLWRHWAQGRLSVYRESLPVGGNLIIKYLLLHLTARLHCQHAVNKLKHGMKILFQILDVISLFVKYDYLGPSHKRIKHRFTFHYHGCQENNQTARVRERRVLLVMAGFGLCRSKATHKSFNTSSLTS